MQYIKSMCITSFFRITNYMIVPFYVNTEEPMYHQHHHKRKRAFLHQHAIQIVGCMYQLYMLCLHLEHINWTHMYSYVWQGQTHVLVRMARTNTCTRTYDKDKHMYSYVWQEQTHVLVRMTRTNTCTRTYDKD